jgi:hypothetical protein
MIIFGPCIITIKVDENEYSGETNVHSNSHVSCERFSINNTFITIYNLRLRI